MVQENKNLRRKADASGGGGQIRSQERQVEVLDLRGVCSRRRDAFRFRVSNEWEFKMISQPKTDSELWNTILINNQAIEKLLKSRAAGKTTMPGQVAFFSVKLNCAAIELQNRELGIKPPMVTK